MAIRPWRTLVAASATFAVLGGCGLAPHANTIRTDLGSIEEAFSSGKGSALVSIAYGNAETLTSLSDAGMDVWGVDAPRHVAYGEVTKAHLALLKQLDVPVKIENRLKTFNTFDKGYHTYDTMLADLQALAAKNPTLCELVDLGPTYETSKGKSNRKVWGLHVRTGDASAKPGVVFLANHHAREIVTPEIALGIAHMMLDGYGTDAEMTAAVDGRDTWIVPMVNPDGHAKAAKGEDWRKNTDPETKLLAEWGAYGAGVDLNRNYTHHWGEGGASTQPQDPTFRGKAAGSEPEVQAIIKLVSSRKFSYLMTYHSFSNLILWPWGFSDDPPPDTRLPAIGKKLASFNGYTPQQSKDLYRTSGDTTDWAFGTQGILSYTSEIGSWGDGFDPPYSKFPQFLKENLPGARYLLKTADNPGAVFGPELKVAAGKIQTQAGMQVESWTKGRLRYTHARIGAGPWGPSEVTWAH